MTRLFNLESYSELCTHANLYNKKNLYETEIQNSLAYKNFLDEYRENGYRSDSPELQKLTISNELIPLKHLGVDLSQGDSNLYVVGDRINSLSLRDFLRAREKYIYRSVYHYWNYRQQIANNLDLNNSVVVVDLNSLSDEPYCSLQFEILPNSPYPIPIIDNRREASSDFKLFLDIKNIHHNIYHALAQDILTCNFLQLANNNNTIEHLKSYLQKIEVFKLANSQTESANFSIIVEIFEREKIYYKSVSLNIALLEEIVVNRIDIQAIAQFAKKHSEYSFVLISDYNFLPKFREALNSSNIFVPTNHLAEFPQIWQEKQRFNFPLFGQYLDKIKFQIQRDGETQWIEVLSTEEQDHIYYEGDPQTRRFIARIQETGQEYFKLLHPDTILPIQINDRDYCINGITQEYKILHPLPELEDFIEELRIRIEFIIKLGSVPELKVTDKENKYDIETLLCDRRQEDVQSGGYIPLAIILENRLKKDSFVPRQDKIQELTDVISQIANISNIEQAIFYRENIERAFALIHRTNNNTDLLLHAASNHSSLKQLQISLENVNNYQLLNVILSYLRQGYRYRDSKSENIKKTVKRFIMFVGKTYKQSSYLNLRPFFDTLFIKQAYQIIGNEYFLFLSRVALNKEFQIAYFQLFLYPWHYNQELYKLDKYLWGYSRILIWYSEFHAQYGKDEFNYLEHFRLIVDYLLSNFIVADSQKHKEYQRNAFVSLIYLLTFREVNPFCAPKSEEYKLAQDVIDKYRNSPVYLKAIPDKSLNECFEELLKGNSSQDTIRRIIEAD